ncbi:MAG: Bug family tripartite tricarboxylate transporter substrate binding protein [Xanthobacteraceae bacterium]
MISRRRLFSTAIATSAVLLNPLSRAVGQFINRPARIIIGFAAGGSLDTIARIIAEQMKEYAPSVIVDNRPGAAGKIALETLKASAADGTTLILTPASPLVLHPHVYKKLNYDPINDFAPVTTVGRVSYDLAVGPKVPDSVKTIQDFVAWCRANPKDAAYGSPGAGSGHHFVGVMFARAAGIDMVHVPYRGAAPAIQDVVAGQIAANISVGLDIPLHKDGKLRILATSGTDRSPFLREVPTFKEAGLDVEATDWFGILAPAGTPDPIIAKINESVRNAIQSKALKDLMAKLGNTPGGESPASFATIIKDDTARWGEIVKASGFTAEE